MPAMNMHTFSLLDATRWHPSQSSTSDLPNAAHDKAGAPKPTGLSQAELRRIVLDLIG